jgi:hypothetical protein
MLVLSQLPTPGASAVPGAGSSTGATPGPGSSTSAASGGKYGFAVNYMGAYSLAQQLDNCTVYDGATRLFLNPLNSDGTADSDFSINMSLRIFSNSMDIKFDESLTMM